MIIIILIAVLTNTEKIINDVLHNEAGALIQEAVKRLMPRSKKSKGKHAKDSDSLINVNGNLSVTVTTKKKFQYLYFPDDGSSTTNHAGNQQFFYKGGTSKQSDVIELCISRLVNDFENSI